MRPDLNIARLGKALYEHAAHVRDAALAPATPLDALDNAPAHRRPLLDRVGRSLADTATAVYSDHLSPWNAASRSYLLVRKFLPVYVLDPPLATAMLVGTALTTLAGTFAGQADLPTVAQRALVLGLLATNLLVFREAEATGMAASAAVHMSAKLLPNLVIAQRPAAWAAVGAYIVVAQSSFETIGLATRPIVPAVPRASTNETCNGLQEICAKALCQTVFPSAHNAMVQPRPFNNVPPPLSFIGMAASDQLLSIEEQFERGIRGFTIEYFPDSKGVLQTSHNTVWSVEPLKDTFVRVRQLLDQHPRDMVRIIGSPQGKYDSVAVSKAFEQDLQDSGLAKYMSTAPSCANRIEVTTNRGGDLCDLQVGSLIESNVRAIVMTSGYAYTTFNAATVADFRDFETLYVAGQAGSSPHLPVVLNLFSTFADWRTSDRVNALMPDLLRVWMSKIGDPGELPSMIIGSHVETSHVVDLADEINRQATLPGVDFTC